MAKHTYTTIERRPEPAPTALGRRSLSAMVAMVACAPVLGATASNPDAELIRLCATFHQAHQASHTSDDEAWEAHLDRRYVITDEIEDMAPVTDAGRLAKARVALVLMEESAEVGNAYERFTLAALRDLLGGAA